MDAGKGERIYAIFRSGEGFLVNGAERDGESVVRTLRRAKGWFICDYIEQSEFMACFVLNSSKFRSFGYLAAMPYGVNWSAKSYN